jgi:MYXO-CTERM domain-containing protein
LTGALEFNGVINGNLSANSSSLVASFPGEITKEIVIGLTRFTVAIEQSEAVGPPGSTNNASITAQATITAEAIIQELPEPGSLALAAFGLGGLCLAAWRRRRTVTA